MQYGKKLFAVPIEGQMEQLSNGVALKSLGLDLGKAKVKRKALQNWLNTDMPAAMNYPDVAAAIAQWIVDGRDVGIEELSQRLWQQVPNLPQPKSPKKGKADGVERSRVTAL